MNGRRIAVLALAAAAWGLVAAAPASAEVNLNINLGPPAVVVHEPPEMIAIPGSMVYFAPGVSVSLLFHDGYWWTPKQGVWYRSTAYGGPWVVVRQAPPAIVHLPPNYRTVYVREKHIPYGQLKKHYRVREADYREGRGEFKGHKSGHGGGHHDGRTEVSYKDDHKGGKEHGHGKKGKKHDD